LWGEGQLIGIAEKALKGVYEGLAAPPFRTFPRAIEKRHVAL